MSKLRYSLLITLFTFLMHKKIVSAMYMLGNTTKQLFKTKTKDINSVRSSFVYKYTWDTRPKVYFGVTDCHFLTRQREHFKGKKILKLGIINTLQEIKFWYIAETLFLCTENKNNAINNQSRSFGIKLYFNMAKHTSKCMHVKLAKWSPNLVKINSLVCKQINQNVYTFYSFENVKSCVTKKKLVSLNKIAVDF